MGATTQFKSKEAREELRQIARFRVALRHFERQTNRVLAEYGLTPQRYLLLLMIEAQAIDGQATVSRLAHDLEMPQSTVTDLVARADGAGLLQRCRAEHDGRVSYLEPTAEGHRRLQAALDTLRTERSTLRATLADLSRLI